MSQPTLPQRDILACNGKCDHQDQGIACTAWTFRASTPQFETIQGALTDAGLTSAVAEDLADRIDRLYVQKLASVALTDDEINEHCITYGGRNTAAQSDAGQAAAHDYAQGAFWARKELRERIARMFAAP